MSPSGADAVRVEETVWSSPLADRYDPSTSRTGFPDQFAPTEVYQETRSVRRRTPRRSVIVILPENHIASADHVSERLATAAEPDDVDVILACAGQPNGITALQRKVRDLQILLAPAGTSDEDLRELAMARAPGDIVTLLNGTALER